jgi:hypothetical protein
VIVNDSHVADRFVAVAFALIVVGGLIFDAAHAWFWTRAHDVAPVAALLVLLLVAALLRRHRFAWWIFVIASVTGVPSWIVRGLTHHVTIGFGLGLLVGIVELALLLSLPMRRYVGVARWRDRSPVGIART